MNNLRNATANTPTTRDKTIWLAHFVCKPQNMQELKALASEAEIQKARVAEVVELSTQEYDVFTSNFFSITPWLAGKGGGNGVIKAIEVRAPSRPRLLINPEGYDNARYVAIEIEAA